MVCLAGSEFRPAIVGTGDSDAARAPRISGFEGRATLAVAAAPCDRSGSSGLARFPLPACGAAFTGDVRLTITALLVISDSIVKPELDLFFPVSLVAVCPDPSLTELLFRPSRRNSRCACDSGTSIGAEIGAEVIGAALLDALVRVLGDDTREPEEHVGGSGFSIDVEIAAFFGSCRPIAEVSAISDPDFVVDFLDVAGKTFSGVVGNSGRSSARVMTFRGLPRRFLTTSEPLDMVSSIYTLFYSKLAVP